MTRITRVSGYGRVAHRLLVTFVAALLLQICDPLAILADELAATDWPQWRGPNRNAQVAGAAWPVSLNEKTLTEIWRVPLGPSYSGPIVTADRVFTTETEDGKREIVRALDRASGRELWRTAWEGALTVPFFAKSNGDWIRATPACDGQRLYVAGMRDVLVCLDAATGRELWRVDFVERYKSPLPAFGFVSSPLIDGDSLFVQAGGAVVKLDKLTGESRWRSFEDGGGMMGSAFASPVLATICGKRQLVVQSREKLAGLEPADGKVLWSQAVQAFRGMNILTPSVIGDTVLTSAYGGKTARFQIKLAPDGMTASELWSNTTQGYMSSPVVIGDYVYLHLRSERVRCLDLKTGEIRWTSQPYGTYWSMVAQGDRILGLGERGTLYLLRATPEKFDLLDQRTLSESPTWGHVAVAEKDVFVRELSAVVAYRWTEPNAP